MPYSEVLGAGLRLRPCGLMGTRAPLLLSDHFINSLLVSDTFADREKLEVGQLFLPMPTKSLA